MPEPKTIEVTLLGRSYRVACEDHEREALMQAVAYLMLAAVERGLGTHMRTGAVLEDPVARAASGADASW